MNSSVDPHRSKEVGNHSRLSSESKSSTVSERISNDFLDAPTSAAPQKAVKVGRLERRGLLASFALLPEVTNPYDYDKSRKWFITFIVAVAGSAAPMGSAIILPCLNELTQDLHTTPKIANLSVALYMLSLSIWPLWWSSFSERLGRRTVYLISFCLFLLWTVLSAISKSISMLIVMRMLSGGAAGSVQAVGAGTISDIWEVKERGQAMGIFYLGPLCGPFLAPIVGGAIAQRFGWRGTQWVLAIFGAVILLFLVLSLPETLRQSLASSKNKNQQLSKAAQSKSIGAGNPLEPVSSTTSIQKYAKRWTIILHQILIDPLKILLLLRFPAVLITVYYASITFGSLYVLSISIQKTFAAPPYGFQTIIIGLLYIPNSLGYIFGSIFGGRWTDYIMQREARAAGRIDEKGTLVLIPEDRMRENAWIAAALYPCALVWYGWTAQKGVIWIVPMIANFFFGIGSMLVFTMATTMLTEFMPRKASNGVAVNNFVRNILSAVGSIIADPLIDAIGNGWLFTGIGVIAGLSSVVIWAMRRYGPGWRENMVKRTIQ